MQPGNITILSTRPLPATLLAEAAAYGIDITVQSFIETTAIQSIEVQQEIEQALLQSATVVFTSMTAAEAVTGYMNGEMPDWAIYCIGQATQEIVKKYFGEARIAGTADNATDLAEQIAEDELADEVIFFCGDQRRNELPSILENHNIEVNEIKVYHTIATPQVIKKSYNGILFFSPSAADSFFSVNKVNSPTTLFAIGNTTANAVKKHTPAPVIVGQKPGKENLVKKAIGYFINHEK